jgi:hypothetical protein
MRGLSRKKYKGLCGVRERRIFTTEYTEFHGGRKVIVSKLRGTPCTPWLNFLNCAYGILVCLTEMPVIIIVKKDHVRKYAKKLYK